MATPTADKLRIFFPSKYLAADGDPLPQYTADAGGDELTIADAALADAGGYWDGAIGWFDGNTLTPALQGQFFHVKSFVTGALTLSRDLPAAPQAGDTYRLVLGGNYRSSHETFGMLVGGVLPELKPVVGVNITGITIKKASAKLGEGTLSVHYDQTLEELYVKMDAQNYGVGLDVSTDLNDATVFAEDGQGWLQVDVVAASLPPDNQTDTWTLSHPQQTLTPDYEGYETKNALAGKTRYRLEAVMNTDPLNAMVGLAVYSGRPYAPPTVISTGGSLGTGQGSFDVDDASAWPTKGFWIKNTAANAGAGDCRYVNYRSGNTSAETFLGFIPEDASPKELLDVSLPDGVYEIEARPSQYFWNEYRGRKVVTLVAGTVGGGTTTTGLPIIQNLRREIVQSVSRIKWKVTEEYAPGAFDFGVWFSTTSPVDTSGAPDLTVSYFAGAGDYQTNRQQTGDEYVAVGAFTPTEQGPVAELYMPWSTVAPDSPADQFAYRNSENP